MSPRTVPTDGDDTYKSLDTKITFLMARWGFARKGHDGSTSWLATAKSPKVATTKSPEVYMGPSRETLFKLAYYGPNKPIQFGVRKRFAKVVGELKKIKAWPLTFAVSPQHLVEFVGFEVRDDAASLERVEKVLKAIAPHRPEYEINIPGDVADLDREFARLGL
jgi:hypothetical protein